MNGFSIFILYPFFLDFYLSNVPSIPLSIPNCLGQLDPVHTHTHSEHSTHGTRQGSAADGTDRTRVTLTLHVEPRPPNQRRLEVEREENRGATTTAGVVVPLNCFSLQSPSDPESSTCTSFNSRPLLAISNRFNQQ